jgi:hypothetical protein
MPVLNLPSLHIDNEAAATLPDLVIAQLVGEEDPDNLSAIAAHWLVTRDFLYTLSIMCVPDPAEDGNAAIIERLQDAVTADEVYRVSDLLSEVDGLTGSLDIVIKSSGGGSRTETLLAVADREDPKEIIGRLLTNDWLAHIAVGYMLRWIVSRWRDPNVRHEASLAKAASVIEEWCRSNGITGGRVQNIIRNLWQKYKTVSHLWAAFYVMKDAEIDLHTPDGFQTFLSTTQWLLETASTIVPKGRRPGEPVLLREYAWQVPASYVRRAAQRATGEDLGIVAVWSNELDAHDIRRTDRPPFMNKPM